MNALVLLTLFMFFKSSVNQNVLKSEETECNEDQVCISLKSCEPFYQLFVRASTDLTDSLWRKHIINSMKDRFCGPRGKRNVCCPKNQKEVIIGSFDINEETVSGDVVLVDSRSVVIKDFVYKGEKQYPPVLIGGSSEKPHADPDNAVVFTFPYEAKSIGIDDARAVLLGSFDGNRNLLLTLPRDLGFNFQSLKWISSWSRDLATNFGHATLVFEGSDEDEETDLESDMFVEEGEFDNGDDNNDEDDEENEDDNNNDNEDDDNDDNDNDEDNDDKIVKIFSKLSSGNYVS